jgi:hypothetical protein
VRTCFESPIRPDARSPRPERCLYWREREVARVALKILLLVATASILSLGSTAAILPQSPGNSGTVDVRFPVPKYYQQYATQDGNPVPTTGRLFLLLPPNFDSRRVWPILIVTATKDRGHTSPSDALWYRAAAAAEGWIVLATDATVRPRKDSVGWRLALLAAGLDALYHDCPKSAQWPVAFAGISGGAKCAQWLGAILAQTHSLNMRGFFLSGINEDQMPEALKTNPAPPGFLRLPIWISSGINDRIATPSHEEQVKGSLVRTGFQNVRLSRFSGGHEVNRADLQSALKWFREEGHF